MVGKAYNYIQYMQGCSQKQGDFGYKSVTKL